MKIETQIKDGYCETVLTSDYKINQKVKFDFLYHPDETCTVKDIKFNEMSKKFKYLLEREDSSEIWVEKENTQEKYWEFPQIEYRGVYPDTEFNLNNLNFFLNTESDTSKNDSGLTLFNLNNSVSDSSFYFLPNDFYIDK